MYELQIQGIIGEFRPIPIYAFPLIRWALKTHSSPAYITNPAYDIYPLIARYHPAR